MKDYYYLLGLKQTATLDEIKDSYRRLSKKFHPDVNDGDAFFAERFKDIQEAYEILSNTERRKLYDLKYSKKSESSSNNSNFSPEIEFFTADKAEVYIGEEIVFNWKTINADDVKIIPIGDVNPIGSLIYLVRHTKSKEFEFKIIAKNSNIDRTVERKIFLKNLTYKEIFILAYNKAYSELYEKQPKMADDSRNYFKNELKHQERKNWNLVLITIIATIAILIVVWWFIAILFVH